MRLRSLLPVRLLRPVQNEDGATLVFFGLMVLVLLGTFALAVDVGAGLNARSEAQRAADSAALAGAGLFRSLGAHLTQAQIEPLAYDTAMVFAELNSVGWTDVEEVDVEVTVWPNERKVGVEIQGQAPIFFAPFLGVLSLPVRAYAEARVRGSGSTDCVKPFAIPDLWQSGATTNVLYDPAEAAAWEGGFTPSPRNDRYEKWNGTLTHTTATGYGSPARNGRTNWLGHSYQFDNGRKLVFKTGTQDPAPTASEDPTATLNAADHFLLDMGNDRTAIPGITCNIGTDVTRNTCQCSNTAVTVGGQVTKEPGNKADLTQGLRILMQAESRNLTWDDVNKRVVDSFGNHVTESTRIIKVVLYNPATASTAPGGSLEVSNVAEIFLEGTDGPGMNVNYLGRFLMYAKGTGAGASSTMLSLQLVK
jgi:hypothetical protein